MFSLSYQVGHCLRGGGGRARGSYRVESRTGRGPSLNRALLAHLSKVSLCYVQGRVIGVNTAIFTNTGTSAGVGFAIPIDIVRSIVPQLIQYGKVVRPALNIQVSPPALVSSKR